MKIKLDENLPTRLAVRLRKLGHEVDTVPEEGLTGYADEDIWSTVCKEGRFLITQDLDFSDIRQFEPGTHPGLLLVRLREPGANALLERIDAIAHTYPIEEWASCFVVLTDHKIRIRKP